MRFGGIITNFAVVRASARTRTHIYNVVGMKQNHTIGFDANLANATPEGKGHYGRFIIDAVAAACPKRGYIRMYTANRQPNAEYDKLELRPNVESMEPDGRVWRWFKPLWRWFGITRDANAGRVELFHGLANKLPFGLGRKNIRSIVTIHDLRFMRNVEVQSPLTTLYYKVSYRSTCRRADRVIAVSNFAKEEIVEHLNIDPDKIDVIHVGCHKRFTESVTPEHSDMIRHKYNLPDNYVLSVGTITENSNIEVIIEALAKSSKPIDLVIAGRATSHIERLKRLTAGHNLTSRTHLLHGVAAEDMPALYANAIAYLSTSRYDGFNYHIVEALNMGTAIIATTGTSHEEAAGPDAIYVSGEDSDAMIEAIERVAMDKELRDTMAERGKEYAQRFRPEVIAYNILKCYNRVGVEIEE